MQTIIQKTNQDRINAIYSNFEKAYEEGVYSDTPTNRKLGRVGRKYSVESKKEINVDKQNAERFLQQLPKKQVLYVHGNSYLFEKKGELYVGESFNTPQVIKWSANMVAEAIRHQQTLHKLKETETQKTEQQGKKVGENVRITDETGIENRAMSGIIDSVKNEYVNVKFEDGTTKKYHRKLLSVIPKETETQKKLSKELISEVRNYINSLDKNFSLSNVKSRIWSYLEANKTKYKELNLTGSTKLGRDKNTEIAIKIIQKEAQT